MKVSVIVPNYNHARFLQQRLDSIHAQTYEQFECIVLDDCSTDNSRELIEKYVVRDRRFTYVFNTANSGSTFFQWNKGVQLAKHELIWIAESDDAADPLLLAKLVKQFEDNPGLVLAYCQSHRMSDVNEVTGSWKEFTDELDEQQFTVDFVMGGKEYIERFLLHRNTIPNASAVVFRKHIYEQAGSAPEELKNNGDWLTWLKMLCYGDIGFVAEPLNYFRYHDKSVIASLVQQDTAGIYREQFDYRMRKAFAHFSKTKHIALSSAVQTANAKYMSWDVGNKGLFYLQQGAYAKGWKHILQASVYPTFQTGFVKRALGIK